jgi:hypothetical protein
VRNPTPGTACRWANAKPRLDLGIDRGDGAVQVFDVGQLPGEEKPLVRSHPPVQRGG